MIKYANLLFVSILFNLSVYGAVIAPQQGGGGSGGSATNAQPPSTVLTNLAFSGVVYVATNDNITLVLSNAPNNTAFILPSFTYAVTPSILNSNLITSTVFQGVKLINKTNITIKGVKGLTVWDGSAGLGEVFVITNCDNVTIEGVTFRGYTNHNFMALPSYGGTTNNNSYLWALVNYYACSRLTFKDCTFERSADHGLQDKGAEGTASGNQLSTTVISTNEIRIINNTFNDIGGMRTNQVGGFQADGTAIVCTDAYVFGNEFKNSYRGVEPYNEGESSGNVTFANTRIQNNSFINIADYGVTLAGSTNGNNIVVDGNYFYREPGFLYHGTNTDASFNSSLGGAINMSGGDRHVIRGNVMRNMAGFGIYIGTAGANPVEGVSIVGNFIDGVTNTVGFGFGIFAGDASGAPVFPVRNAYIANNTIRNAKTYAAYLIGIADTVFEGNQLINPVFPGGYTAVLLQSYLSSVASNNIVRNNVIKDTGTAEMTYGIQVTAGVLAVQTFNNTIENGTTGTINNGAGTGLTQYDTVSSSTNRILRAFDSGAAQITSVTSTTVTAQSFIGSGESTPYLLLSSPNGASFGLSVNTNLTVQTTNKLDFASAAVGQAMVLHSAAAGQLVWTNATTVEVPVPGLVSNVVAMKWNIWTNYVNTVSNFVFTFNTNRYELKNQTNIWFTNIVEEATAVGADMSVHVHNTTAAAMNLYWPAYGAQHGYFLQTNANNPILSTTTLAAGAHGVASFTAYGTNIFATFSTWP